MSRQINKKKYDIVLLVNAVIQKSADETPDKDNAEKCLKLLGNDAPSEGQILTYAYEALILKNLALATGAWGFERQIGRINFDSVDTIVEGVNDYLNRRNYGWKAKNGKLKAKKK